MTLAAVMGMRIAVGAAGMGKLSAYIAAMGVTRAVTRVVLSVIFATGLAALIALIVGGNGWVDVDCHVCGGRGEVEAEYR